MDRREFVQTLSAGALSMGLPAQAGIADAKGEHLKIGMCDWNLMGGTCQPEKFELAAKVGLNGVQVSVATDPKNVALRNPEVRRQYQEMMKQHNVAVCSVAAGGILNSYPLATEPQSAVFVIDAVEAAADLGADNILIAFFGNGDLRLTDGRNNIGEELRTGDPDGSFKLDEKKVYRLIEVLRQIVPRAEAHGVILGLENTLTAKQTLDIIREVGSEMVQMYYDLGNSTAYGYKPVEEILMLGKKNICEVHLKDWKTPMLGSKDATVDMAGCAESLRKIGYEKWLVLETSGRENQFEADTKTNIAYARETFG